MKIYKLKRITAGIIALVLCMGLIPQITIKRAYAAVAGDAVIYAVDGDEEYEITDAENGSISSGAFEGVGINVYRDNAQLSFNKTGNGAYTLSASGTESELFTDSDGKIVVSGLDVNEYGYNFRSSKNGVPEGYYIPEYYADASKKDGIYYGVLQLYSRQAKIKATDMEGNGLNGAMLWLENSLTFDTTNDINKSKLSFVKISEGVYRIAEEGETATQELYTATVNGEDGVVLIDNIPVLTDDEKYGTRIIIDGRFEKAPEGYGTKVNLTNRWNEIGITLYSPSDRVHNFDETAEFALYNNDTPESANPAEQIGYGTWKLNTSTSDEFNGDFIDQSRWEIDSTYSEANNGYAELKSVVTEGGELSNASLVSKIGMKYGYYETCFRGTYVPAMNTFYMINSHNGNKDNKEIDIAENHPSSRMDEESGCYDYINSHDWNEIYPLKGGGDFEFNLRGSRNIVVEFPEMNGKNSLSDNFYVYGCLYEPDKLTYYINGEVVYIDYVQSAWRSMNLAGYNMKVIIENNGSYADMLAGNYTQDEWNNTKRADGSGLNINTLYLDYFRYYERTDKIYTDVPYIYSDDKLTSTLEKTPQTSIEGAWTYQTALSDEFDDNEIDMDFTDKEFDFHGSDAGLWKRVASTTVNEHNQTMRLPVEVYDKYTKNDYSSGYITSVVHNEALYGDGYYEFRGKAANCDCRSSLIIAGSNGSLWVELYGDPLDAEFQYQKNLIKFGGEIGTGDGAWVMPIEKTFDEDLTAGYHVFGVLAEGNTYTLYVDDEEFGTITSKVPLGNNITVTLSTEGPISEREENGIWSAGDSIERLMDTNRDTNFYIDYIRYYTKSDEQPPMTVTADYTSGKVNAAVSLSEGTQGGKVVLAVFNNDGKMLKTVVKDISTGGQAALTADCGTVSGGVAAEVYLLDTSTMKPVTDAWKKKLT